MKCFMTCCFFQHFQPTFAPTLPREANPMEVLSDALPRRLATLDVLRISTGQRSKVKALLTLGNENCLVKQTASKNGDVTWSKGFWLIKNLSDLIKLYIIYWYGYLWHVLKSRWLKATNQLQQHGSHFSVNQRSYAWVVLTGVEPWRQNRDELCIGKRNFHAW